MRELLSLNKLHYVLRTKHCNHSLMLENVLIPRVK